MIWGKCFRYPKWLLLVQCSHFWFSAPCFWFSAHVFGSVCTKHKLRTLVYFLMRLKKLKALIVSDSNLETKIPLYICWPCVYLGISPNCHSKSVKFRDLSPTSITECIFGVLTGSELCPWKSLQAVKIGTFKQKIKQTGIYFVFLQVWANTSIFLQSPSGKKHSVHFRKV